MYRIFILIYLATTAVNLNAQSATLQETVDWLRSKIMLYDLDAYSVELTTGQYGNVLQVRSYEPGNTNTGARNFKIENFILKNIDINSLGWQSGLYGTPSNGGPCLGNYFSRDGSGGNQNGRFTLRLIWGNPTDDDKNKFVRAFKHLVELSGGKGIADKF